MKSVVLEGPSRRMSALDAAFLHFEKAHAPLSIGCVAVLDGPVSRDELLRHLDSHLAGIGRFTQRAAPAPFSLVHPSWRPDRGFDLRNHVHRSGVPRPGGEAELCEAVAELMERPLERERPLWEAHLLEGLCDERTAVVHRVHHCMLDGVAGAGVLDVLLDTEPAGGRERPTCARGMSADDEEPVLGQLGRVLADSWAEAGQRWRQALGLLQHPDRLRRGIDPAWSLSLWTLRRLLEAPAPLPWNGPIGRRRCVAFARFPLEPVRAVCAARHCTVNDVVLSVLAGGLRRYLESVGIEAEAQPLLAAVPVSLRTPMQGTALGNRLGVLLVPMSLEAQEEADRLARTAAITRRLKEQHGLDAITALLAVADLLPPPLLAWLSRRAQIPCLPAVIATNVRGPAAPRYLAGRRVEAVYPLVPVADGLGLGVAVLSYAGAVYVGLNADADRMPDLEKLRVGIEESVARLLALL